MIRAFICLVIVMLSFAGGYLYSLRFTARTAAIKDLKEKLNAMEREIMFSMRTLPDICKSISEEGGHFSKVFARMGEELEKSEHSFDELWKHAVKEEFKGSSLKKEQTETLADLLKGLGKGDIEEQQKCFARINSEIDILFSHAEEESRRLKKMYMSLFVYGGITISIILI